MKSDYDPLERTDSAAWLFSRGRYQPGVDYYG